MVIVSFRVTSFEAKTTINLPSEEKNDEKYEAVEAYPNDIWRSCGVAGTWKCSKAS